MTTGFPDRSTAEAELKLGEQLNPGTWGNHSRYVARAAEIIGSACGMDEEKAYIFGLLHDIGRRIGFGGQKHIYAGYRYALEKGWPEIARISLTHSYFFNDPYVGVSAYDGAAEEFEFIKNYIYGVTFDDYDRLIQLCDALGSADGFCSIEKRAVDVALRYGEMPGMIEKWRKMFEVKHYFDDLSGGNIYDLLPGIRENI